GRRVRGTRRARRRCGGLRRRAWFRRLRRLRKRKRRNESGDEEGCEEKCLDLHLPNLRNIRGGRFPSPSRCSIYSILALRSGSPPTWSRALPVGRVQGV